MHEAYRKACNILSNAMLPLRMVKMDTVAFL